MCDGCLHVRGLDLYKSTLYGREKFVQKIKTIICYRYRFIYLVFCYGDATSTFKNTLNNKLREAM